MPNNNDTLSRSPTSHAGRASQGTTTRAPASLLFSHKNLETAQERAGAKPKSGDRINTWINEVRAETALLPLPTYEPPPPPTRSVKRVFTKIFRTSSTRSRNSEETETFYNTRMYDGVPEGGVYEAGHYYAPSFASSMNFGSEDSRFAPPGLRGFDRVQQREDRLARANELWLKSNQPGQVKQEAH